MPSQWSVEPEPDRGDYFEVHWFDTTVVHDVVYEVERRQRCDTRLMAERLYEHRLGQPWPGDPQIVLWHWNRVTSRWVKELVDAGDESVSLDTSARLDAIRDALHREDGAA